MAGNRTLGCLSIFLFVALCASLFVNFVLIAAGFQRLAGTREPEPIPRFREILLQKGMRGSLDKIAVISMHGLISSSLPGSVSDSMVDDMRAALQQARDDSRVKAIVLEIDSPGGEVTASDAIYSAVVKTRAKKPVVVYMGSLAASGGNVDETLRSALFRSRCPVTGQPDYGDVMIRYRGQRIDRAGLLGYLISFRRHPAFHESCVERIFVDILSRCAPRSLTVYARFMRRGGIDINPFRSNFEPGPPRGVRTPRQ